MKLINTTFNEFEKLAKNKRIVLYGLGQTLEPSIDNLKINEEWNPIDKVIDKGKIGEKIDIAGKCYEVCSPNTLKLEKNCLIIIISVKYLYEIYSELEMMRLDDSVEVISIALMRTISCGLFDADIWNEIEEKSLKPIIPRVINTFWFSGDPLPEAYQKCVDTWKKHCPEYEIKVWNLDNYNGNGNKYFQDAINDKKWAFASDYARFDVIYRYGGIYMDADVFLLKSFDKLLGMKAFWGYTNWNSFQSETFGSIPKNDLIGKLVELYENIEYTHEGKHDPILDGGLYKLFKKEQLPLDGNLCIHNEMALLPWNCLSVLDNYVFRTYTQNENSIAIHMDNYSWGNETQKNELLLKNRSVEGKLV